MLGADIVLFALAFYCAYLFRFDFALSEFRLHQYLELLKYLLSIKVAVFFGLGLYRGMWRYTSLSDVWRIFEATFLQSVLLVTVVLYKFGFAGFSRGIFIIDWVLAFLFTGGLRICIRSAYSYQGATKGLEHGSGGIQRLIIIGAGRAGEKITREIRENPSLRYDLAGFVDDDPAKQGRTLHGKPVLGKVEDLERIALKHEADEILIAITEASAQDMRRIVDACKRTGLKHRILPGMGEILDGKAGLKALREVNYLDLLGRAPVALDDAGIREYITGQTILVTGCGGSIGSELCRQLVPFAPGRLVLVDASEFNLYQIEMELKHEFKFTRYATVLGNIADRPLMDQVFGQHRPRTVFHAAAYKHVPMLERNPWQAVTNNILGTRAVMEAAVASGVERFVVVSTDKAVRPTNVMGASKRVTELLMQRFADTATRFMAVRFGNVVGSSGSVIPLFRRQIEQGGPLTVTHPEVTRYFMSIAEAAQLILQAGAMGRGQEIFVLKMGQPVKIADMAQDLIRLSGKEPGVDIEIVFTGLREGEKLYEELITEGEGIARTAHEKIMVLERTCEVACGTDALDRSLTAMTEAASGHDGEAVRRLLVGLVPEYQPAPASNSLK
jgi:FlaA1/EpsC-like NDP-sugar epimerase